MQMPSMNSLSATLSIRKFKIESYQRTAKFNRSEVKIAEKLVQSAALRIILYLAVSMTCILYSATFLPLALGRVILFIVPQTAVALIFEARFISWWKSEAASHIDKALIAEAKAAEPNIDPWAVCADMFIFTVITASIASLGAILFTDYKTA